MKISMIGCGYVGLVTGACFAKQGNEVICMDNDELKINNLKNGIVPIYEPGLEEIVKANISERRLKFTTNLYETLEDSLVNFIAVPTPSLDKGDVNLNYIEQVAFDIGKIIKNYSIIVNKSTAPMGTSKKIKNIIKNKLYDRKVNIDFDVVSNPEFLREGTAVEDFLKPDRIIIGLDSEKAKEIMKELYAPFILNQNPILFMTNEDAEMVKYACNSYLANKISFINELANICGKVGSNIKEVKKGMILDPRIGKEYLYPGIGYGGSCLPKDVRGLINVANSYGYNPILLNAIDKINEEQPNLFFNMVNDYYRDKEFLDGKLLTIWGLSFKPETDDIREAPSLKLINKLLDKNVKLNVYDPKAMENIKVLFKNKLNYSNEQYESLKNSHGLILLTEWSEFRSPDFFKIKSLLKTPVIFDGRNIYDQEKLNKLGFDYFGIGV